MKRSWEIYLDMLVLAGWYVNFSRKFDYEAGAMFVMASASNGNLHLQGTGATIKEALENLARHLIN